MNRCAFGVKILWFCLVSATVSLATGCSGNENEPPPETNQKEVQSEPPPEKIDSTPAKPELPKEKKPEYPVLNNDNCVAFLTEFGAENPETLIAIETTFGTIKVRLFKDTPLHRANFIYLIKRNYFDPVEMTRVIKGFMIQGGNSQERRPSLMRTIIGNYTIPPEFHLHRIHQRGALALSRQYNPKNDIEKRSASYDFYLVQGKRVGDVDLYEAEQRRKKKYTPAQVKTYKKTGGAAHLDYQHTVFGQVVSGMGVIDKIAKLPVDKKNWPRERVFVNISLSE